MYWLAGVPAAGLAAGVVLQVTVLWRIRSGLAFRLVTAVVWGAVVLLTVPTEVVLLVAAAVTFRGEPLLGGSVEPDAAKGLMFVALFVGAAGIIGVLARWAVGRSVQLRDGVRRTAGP